MGLSVLFLKPDHQDRVTEFWRGHGNPVMRFFAGHVAGMLIGVVVAYVGGRWRVKRLQTFKNTGARNRTVVSG